jgi:hypothetical protein
MARMNSTVPAGVTILLVAAAACATSGGGAGTGGPEPGDSGGQVETGHDAGSTYEAGSGADAGDAQGTMDSGGTIESGGGQPDSGPCSLTSTSLCGNGAECCFLDGGAVCDCQTGTLTQGATCSSTMGCGPGYVCGVATGMTTGTCFEWCDYPSGTCPSSTTCQELIMPAPVVGGVTYGECM